MATVILVTVTMPAAGAQAVPTTTTPPPTAAAEILVDVTTGHVLYQENAPIPCPRGA